MTSRVLNDLSKRRVPRFDGTLREALHRFFWVCKGQPIEFVQEKP